jgi:hypothetical protein
MRYAFSESHLSSLILDFYLDFYSGAMGIQSNYIFHIDKPCFDLADLDFIGAIRRAYKEYAAFSVGQSYFESCFSMKNIDSIDFGLIKFNIKTKVNTMVIVHACNSSQVTSMVIYIHELAKKYMAKLTADNPDEHFFMGDITIIVQQMRKNKKFLTNGKDEDIFLLAMKNYIAETKKKGKTILIKLDVKELITRWKKLRQHNFPEAKQFPISHYYHYFRSSRTVERIKRLKGSLA